MFCPNCGKRLPDGARFCTSCGARVVDEAPADMTQTAVTPVQDSSADVTRPQPRVDLAADAGDAELVQRRRRAIIAIAAVAALVVVGIVVAFLLSNARSDEGAPASGVTAEEPAAPGEATIRVVSVDTTAYPDVVVDCSVVLSDDSDISVLSAADFVLTESAATGVISDVQVQRVSTSPVEGICTIAYTSSLAADDDTHTLDILLDDASGFTGQASITFMVAGDAEEGDAEEGDAELAEEPDTDTGEVAGDYVLPDSGTRLIDASELEGLSDWELLVARNEIYARHGRGFTNERLQEYFDSKSWYTRRYDPEEFDALEGEMSQTEIANVETILAAEQARTAGDGADADAS